MKQIVCLALVLGFMASAPAFSATLLGTLKTQNKIVEIYSGEQAPRYTVIEDGKTTAALVDEAELKRVHPDVHALVQEGMARDASLSRELVVPEKPAL